LKISIAIDGNSPLVEVITPGFFLNPGMTIDFSDLKTQSLYNYFQNEYSDEFQNNSICKYQMISVCINLFKSPENILVTKSCQDYKSSEIRALHLIYPQNRDTIENIKPLLHWEAINIPQSDLFHIRLTEVLEEQEHEIALDLNPPI